MHTQKNRKLTLNASEIVDRAISQNGLQFWRLVISSSTFLKIEITIFQENTTRTITMFSGANGITDYNGYGSFNVKITNLDTSNSNNVELSIEQSVEDTMYQVEGDVQTVTGGIWTPLNPNLGYAPPFCNYLSIIYSATCQVRIIDGVTGTALWNSGNLATSQKNNVNEIRIPKTARVDVKDTGASTNFQAIWFKKV